MLFTKRSWAGLLDGSITRTYRVWRSPQVVAGRPYRTPVGMLHVHSVRVVALADVSDEDAIAAGWAAAAELVAALGLEQDATVYEVCFEFAGADPRDALAADDSLGPEDAAVIAERLERLDRASSCGPWTTATLRAIADHPGVRAAELASMLGRERAPFKLDVRKLKALGLTISLEVGYRISPRGEAVLRTLPAEGHT